MREFLPEKLRQRLRLRRQSGLRRVVAHRADGFGGVFHHRPQNEFYVLGGAAESDLARAQIEIGNRSRIGALAVAATSGQRIEIDLRIIRPTPPRTLGREFGFDFVVGDKPPRFEIDQQNAAGLEPPFFDDFGIGNPQNPGFGSHNHKPVAGNPIATGAQAVAIESRADLQSVAENDSGRAVPRLHHRRVVAIKIAQRGRHVGAVLPRFGD